VQDEDSKTAAGLALSRSEESFKFKRQTDK